MGCSGSKLEELEAVALCRGRTDLLADAIRQRYALADAHAAYVISLRSVGISLHRFLDSSHQEILSSSSPVLPLPAQRKGDPLPPSASSPPLPPRHSHSHSGGSGSHIQFQSSDGDGSGSDSPLHSENSSPSPHHLHFHQQHQERFDETLGGPPFVNYNFSRSQPQPPSVHFDPVLAGGEQRPAETLAGPTSVSYHYARSQPQPSSIHFAPVPGGGGDHHLDEKRPAETLAGPTVNYHYARNQPQPPSVHFATSASGGGGGGGDPSSSSAPPPYSNYSNYPYPSAYPTNNYYGYGFFGPSSSSPPLNLAPPAGPFGAAAAESSAKPPPPPPSPPRVSTWDFLNPFEAHDNYYPSYPPSRSSREVRDEEGIPDLEEEVDEIVKEVYGEQKFVGSTSKEYNPKGNEEGIESVGENSRSNEVENEEDVVEKKVVADEVRRPELQQNAAAAASSSKPPRQYHNVSEIGSEIRVQFERASDAASELSMMLEVGKHPYRHKRSSVVGVASRMMCAMPPSSSDGEDFLSLEEDIAASSKNLSSTLQKLYIWEKKLQDEVRDEEKMRLLHEKNCKRMRYLAERGADAQKLEDVQKFIKKLSTKIRIAIQVVDSISNKINTLRDDELWPCISELIQGLMKMWKVLLECHRIQCQAISEAKGLDSIASGGKLNDTQLSAMVDLELELLRWTGNFASWINAQKKYVKALNGWLVLCLHYEPEVTADGVPPYSPGRIGAPPVFVICNSWSQALDRLSEMEVINAMQAVATNLRLLWEQHSVDPRQKTMPNGDMDRLVRDREREAQVVLREVDSLNKKIVLVSGQNELPNYSAGASSLHLGLKQIFEAMENFTANSFKAYEELHMRSEEEKVASEHAKSSG